MSDLRGALRWAADHSLPTVLAANALAGAVFVLGPALLNQTPSHGFLLWNLALAWVPFVAALGLEAYSRMGRRRSMWACGVVWLLFLPNAPYLLTDLHHLGDAEAMPWLNLARFVAFAWAGLVLGLASVRIVHREVEGRRGQVAGWTLVLGAAMASGAGIAVGRFARLNSWQVITQPGAVASELVRLSGNAQALAVAAFFCFLLLVMYSSTSVFRAPRRS